MVMGSRTNSQAPSVRIVMSRSDVRLVCFFECLPDLLPGCDELLVERVPAAALSITGGRCIGIAGMRGPDAAGL